MNQTPSLKVSFYQFLLVTMTTVIREGNITQVTLRGYIQNEHYKLLLSLRSDTKMRIVNLCCHCKNFIQNAYCKFMLSFKEFYSKCVSQTYAVIARILCQTRVANLCCHCRNFIFTIHCNHSLGFFFKTMQQASNNEPSEVPQ